MTWKKHVSLTLICDNCNKEKIASDNEAAIEAKMRQDGWLRLKPEGDAANEIHVCPNCCSIGLQMHNQPVPKETIAAIHDFILHFDVWDAERKISDYMRMKGRRRKLLVFHKNVMEVQSDQCEYNNDGDHVCDECGCLEGDTHIRRCSYVPSLPD
jgi:hypothetical protein